MLKCDSPGRCEPPRVLDQTPVVANGPPASCGDLSCRLRQCSQDEADTASGRASHLYTFVSTVACNDLTLLALSAMGMTSSSSLGSTGAVTQTVAKNVLLRPFCTGAATKYNNGLLAACDQLQLLRGLLSISTRLMCTGATDVDVPDASTTPGECCFSFRPCSRQRASVRVLLVLLKNGTDPQTRR